MFRKQYHSRFIDGDRHIWDVHRLVRLTESLPMLEVKLSDMPDLDTSFWYEPGKDIPTLRSIAEHALLIQAADLQYPIILAPDGTLMDGAHRLCKALMLGHETIWARRFAVLPTPDYVNRSLDELEY